MATSSIWFAIAAKKICQSSKIIGFDLQTLQRQRVANLLNAMV
ncbi:hypothetical protein [Myxacorys almedinensis]|nr:hypothetical protein [Myxacorys almedinensis]